MKRREFHGGVELPLVGQGTWEIDTTAFLDRAFPLGPRRHGVPVL